MSLLMLLLIICVTITITSNIGSCENKSSVRDCIKLSTTDVEPNSTSCNYKREFPLPEGYAVSVCSNLNEIRICLTEFVNEGSTIQGFYLNTRQYNYFKRLIPHISETIRRARIQEQLMN